MKNSRFKARIAQSTIDQVKERADIHEIVSEYVVLKKAGRSFVGLCPFHEEKSPSFSVSPDKQMYYCFGCGKGGNAIGFLRELGRSSFVETITGLADRYGIPIETEDPEDQARYSRERSRRQQMLSAMSDSVAYFQSCLNRPEGNDARSYLAGRGITADIVARHQIGFAPSSWDGLLTYLQRRGHDAEIIDAAGLTTINENKRRYDRFRNRVIVPIRDENGRVIAFGARSLGDEKPKYLNSPETDLFDKSRTLYGLDRAKDAISADGAAIVVEGYFDVIALHEAGISSAVAVLGTAMSEANIKKLLRFGERIVANFDSDSAGEKAANRTIELVSNKLSSSSEIDLRILQLPAGFDADEFVRAYGTDSMQSAITAAPLWREWRIDRVAIKYNFADSGDYQKCWQQMRALLLPVQDKVVRAQIAQRCAIWLANGDNTKLPSIQAAIEREMLTGRRTVSISKESSQKTSPQAEPEVILFRLFLHRPDLRPLIQRTIGYLHGLKLTKQPMFTESGLAGAWQLVRDSADPISDLINSTEIVSPSMLNTLMDMSELIAHQIENGKELVSATVATIEQQRRHDRVQRTTEKMQNIGFSNPELSECLRREIQADRMAIQQLQLRRQTFTHTKS
jgi:DNA primase